MLNRKLMAGAAAAALGAAATMGIVGAEEPGLSDEGQAVTTDDAVVETDVVSDDTAGLTDDEEVADDTGTDDGTEVTDDSATDDSATEDSATDDTTSDDDAEVGEEPEPDSFGAMVSALPKDKAWYEDQGYKNKGAYVSEQAQAREDVEEPAGDESEDETVDDPADEGGSENLESDDEADSTSTATAPKAHKAQARR